MQRQLLPHDQVADSLEAHLHRHSRRSQAIYVATILLLLAAMAMLPVVRIGVSVQGQGIVRPVTEKHEVKARTAGFAELLSVREQERVPAGHVLLRLRTAPLDLRQSLVASQLDQARTFVHDLEMLTRDASGALATDRFQSAKYRQEYVQLQNELREIALKEEKALREVERARALATRSLIPAREAEDIEFQLSQIRSEKVLLLERYQSGWQGALAGAVMNLRELRSQIEHIEEEGNLYQVETPVSGTVEQLASISPGSYVQAGEQIAVISPNADLVAEVYVTPRDIGLLREGTPVRVLVDAFNYNDWGFVGGSVTEISDDYLMIGQQPMFRVGVQLDRDHLTLKNGFRGDLKKGMTLRARFMVTERTLWQLLRDDVNDWLNPVGT